MLEIAELVHNRFRAYARTKTSFLDSKELQMIDSYEAQLREEQRLDQEEWDFIAESRRVARQKRQRTRWITTAVIAGLSVFLLFAGIQWQIAKGAKDEAVSAQETAEANEKLPLMLLNNP